MKHVIIGTAGHVDHGKTLLVKALTGIETDRLKEEKKRGITIELGFAHITFENGMQAGIVDVPGHEGFIKNMLMGAGGVDFAMLVVAADEGFMPQTVEHLDILTLLGLKSGVVVITKRDLVEPDFLEMVIEDVREKTVGSFLEGCEIIPVSAYTGEGMSVLKERLLALTAAAKDKNIYAPFRLPIDRVFSMDGFGTVVTGTLTDGQVADGEQAMIYPQGIETRVRNIQVHKAKVEKAYAGQRVAVNLAGVKKEQIQRGSVVAFPGTVQCNQLLDVRLSVLSDSNRTIKNNSMLHLYHGSAGVLCKVTLLDTEELLANQACFAQLRLTESIGVREGDRFVVRFYSPLETIGGGVILSVNPAKHKRGDAAVLQELAVRETGSDRDRVLCAVRDGAANYQSWKNASKALTLLPEQQQEELEALKAMGEILEYHPAHYIDQVSLRLLGEKASRLLGEYHQSNPLSNGIKREEMRQKLFGRMETTLCDQLLLLLARDGVLDIQDTLIAKHGFSVEMSPRHQKILDRLKEFFADGGFSPPASEEAYALFPKDKEGVKQVMAAMLAEEMLVALAPQIVMDSRCYQRALALATAHFEQNQILTLPQARDMLQTSRKYALALLEYWDRIKLTRMQGEGRILLQK